MDIKKYGALTILLGVGSFIQTKPETAPKATPAANSEKFVTLKDTLSSQGGTDLDPKTDTAQGSTFPNFPDILSSTPNSLENDPKLAEAFKRHFLDLLNDDITIPDIQESRPSVQVPSKTDEKPSLFRTSSLSLEDFAGDVPKPILDMIDMIKNPGNYSKYNMDLPNFMLLHGPSGTGKTLLGEIIAGETNARYAHTVSSALLKRYYGEGVTELKNFFETARKEHQKNPDLKFVIFIDEIDMMLLTETKEEQRSDLRHVLNEQLDMHTPYIFVIGATNRLGHIDETTKRRAEGYVLEIGLPDKKARQILIDHYLKKLNLSKYAVLFKDLAAKTEGFSNAHIKSILKHIVIRVCRDKAQTIERKHIKDAYNDVRKTITVPSISKWLENTNAAGWFKRIGTEPQTEALAKVIGTALVSALLQEAMRRIWEHYWPLHPQQQRFTIAK